MRSLLCLLSLCLSTLVALAAPYQVGDRLEPLGFKDQHEKAYVAEPGLRRVIVSFAMSVGKDANRFFAEKGAAFLGEQKTVFIANIEGMPAVGRFFALPKMKRYPHRILLADGEPAFARFPSQEDKLTVIDLKPDGTIAQIRFIDAEKELAGLFP